MLTSLSSLSWLIYLSDVFDSFKNVLIFAGAAAGVGVAMQVFVTLVTEGTYTPRHLWSLCALCLSFLLVSALIPQRQTVLMIAAIEAGTAVAQTDTAKELLDDTVRLIRKRLREATEDAPSDARERR